MYQKVQKVLFIADLPKEDADGIDQTLVEETVTPIPRIRTHFNSKYYVKNQEVNTGVDMTVPDEAMTVMEIMRRHASGLPMTGGKIPMYEEEGDMPDISHLDLAERQLIIEEAQAEIKRITEDVEKRKTAAAEMRMEKLIKERLEKKAAEQPPKKEEPV